jgi:predicted flap endonuclease-1-like 5' DNA nuclease
MSQDFWIGLCIGLAAGWGIEWLIDWKYWRARHALIVNQLEETKENLRIIKGLGKKLEKRLNQAGIYSFSALAALTQDELEHIVGDAKERLVGKDLIQQAKKIREKKHRKRQGEE